MRTQPYKPYKEIVHPFLARNFTILHFTSYIRLSTLNND